MMLSDLLRLLNHYAPHGDMEVRIYNCDTETSHELKIAGLDARNAEGNGPMLFGIKGLAFPWDSEDFDWNKA